MADHSKLVTPIQNEHYEGERPLAFSRDLLIMHTAIGPGSGALLECERIEAHQCTFDGRRTFWHNHGSNISHSSFSAQAGEGVWYAEGIDFRRNQVEAPCFFRHSCELRIEDCAFTQAAETLWMCSAIRIRDCTFAGADHLFMHSGGIEGRKLEISGRQCLQYIRDSELHDCTISGEGALWGCQNVKIYDSVLHGDGLGWHSSKLHLISCTIHGRQPLCHARNLIIEDCRFGPDCELAFEYSSVIANIDGTLPSVINPQQGLISAQGYGQIIVDEHDRSSGKCMIKISGV